MSRHLEPDKKDFRVATSEWKCVWRLGGIAVFILMIYCVDLMVQRLTGQVYQRLTRALLSGDAA